MNRESQNTPKAVVEGGRVNLGRFALPFRMMNILDPCELNAKSRFKRWLRLKEWVGFGLDHPHWYGAMLIQDAKYLASAAIYLFSRKSQKLYQYISVRFDRQVKIASTLWNDHSCFRASGFFMHFDHRLDQGYHRITIDIAEDKKNPRLKADLTFYQDLHLIQPLVVCLPLKTGSFAYTHKSPLFISGHIRLGEEEMVYEKKRDLTNLDEHKAFYPYRTKWLWATFAGYDEHRRLLALNISDQMFKDQDIWNENAVWVEGRLFYLGRAEFSLKESDPHQPWQIRETNGNADLTFTPEGGFFQKRNLLLLKMDYFQMFGRFNGWIKDEMGRQYPIKDLYGVAERMDARF